MPTHSITPRSLPLALIVFALVAAPALRALDWLPIAPEDLSATASTVDPDAGAEILYRLKQIDCNNYKGTTDEYIRIKVYTEKGVRQLDKVDVEYSADSGISSINARVIKPDGNIINVEKKAFYDREIVKYGDVKIRVRSFSFPRLEPGDIAEYKTCIVSDEPVLISQFNFLGEMPARHVVLRVRPVPLYAPYQTMAYYYMCAEQKIQHTKDGFSFVEMKNQPAFVSEPDMEPENNVQPWLLFYPARTDMKPDEFWKETAADVGAKADKYSKKPSKLVRETATRVAAGATGVEERLARLTDYCRANIVNYYHYIPEGGLDKKAIGKKERTPDDLINTKLGHCDDIPILFVAMARSLGIDARIALCANRRNGTFNKNLPLRYYLDDMLVAGS